MGKKIWENQGGKMIILALAIGALCLYAGYKWGFGRGQTEIEWQVINYVLRSPEYGNQIVDAIRKSLAKVKK